MDISEQWITENIKIYFHIIMDNYSRKVLGLKISLNKSSQLALENLKEVYNEFKLEKQKEIMIMINDNGSENKSVTMKYINSLTNMTQKFTNRSKKTD